MKHEAAFRTARTDVKIDNKDTSACTEILNSKCGEDGKDGIDPRRNKRKL